MARSSGGSNLLKSLKTNKNIKEDSSEDVSDDGDEVAELDNEKKAEQSKLIKSGFDVGVTKAYGSFFSSLRERTDAEMLKKKEREEDALKQSKFNEAKKSGKNEFVKVHSMRD